MNVLGDGATTTLVLLFIALLVHEPWRWVGLYLGRGVDVGSELFQWVRSVATALVAGLVMRLLLFPPGALATVGPGIRIGAFLAGIAIYFLTKRNLAAGVAGGGAALLVAGMIIG